MPTLHAGAVVLGLHVGSSLLWSDAFDVTDTAGNWRNFKRAWTTAPHHDASQGFFRWDSDPWAHNLIGHSVMGSEFYLRHRQARFPAWAALGMTLAWTLVWEYLVEAWHKQPSGIDLIWSPVGGAMLGEGRYQLYRRVRRMERSAGRHVLLYLIDPLGQLERDLLGLSF